MQKRLFRVWILALFCLFPAILSAESILVRTDSGGKRVFYNIPPKTRVLPDGTFESIAVYYSSQAQNYVELIHDVCSQYGVDAELVRALIQVESAYNYRAISPKGARGLMQLMPATAFRYGVQEIFDPRQNIEGGVKYLKDLLQLFNSDIRLVLAAYNAGERVVSQLNDIPNYTETQNYVRKVLALYKGDSSFSPYAGGGKPRNVTYYKYLDEKGVTHYSVTPVSGVQVTKVSFYY